MTFDFTGKTAVLSGAASAEKIPVFEKKAGSVKPFDEIAFTYYIRAEAGKEELADALSDYHDSDIASVIPSLTEQERKKLAEKK